MDSAVSKEGMYLQVVIVMHNVLPIRSLRWQNIPRHLLHLSIIFSFSLFQASPFSVKDLPLSLSCIVFTLSSFLSVAFSLFLFLLSIFCSIFLLLRSSCQKVISSWVIIRKSRKVEREGHIPTLHIERKNCTEKLTMEWSWLFRCHVCAAKSYSKIFRGICHEPWVDSWGRLQTAKELPYSYCPRWALWAYSPLHRRPVWSCGDWNHTWISLCTMHRQTY